MAVSAHPVKKQDCITGSSTHAEVVAASSTSNDTLWFRGAVGDMGLPQPLPTPLWVDAQNVLTLVQNLLSSNKVRHIKRRELIVREREAAGEVIVKKIPTNDNLADMLTKVLDREPFERLRRSLMQLIRVGAQIIGLLSPHSRRRSQTTRSPDVSDLASV